MHSIGAEEWERWTGSAPSVAGVGDLPGVIERALPWEEAEKFDASVVHLQTDVAAWIKESPVLQRAAFGAKWDGFLVKWKTWFGARQAGLLRIIAGSDLTEFEAMQAEFNELRRQFVELGGFTSVKPSNSQSPASAFIEEILPALKTVAVIGVVGLVGYAILTSQMTSGVIQRGIAKE